MVNLWDWLRQKQIVHINNAITVFMLAPYYFVTQSTILDNNCTTTTICSSTAICRNASSQYATQHQQVATQQQQVAAQQQQVATEQQNDATQQWKVATKHRESAKQQQDEEKKQEEKTGTTKTIQKRLE